MFTDGFIKDLSILEENSRVDDLLDLSEYASKYLEKVEGYSDKSMIALKGRFGIGKSTFLHQLEKKLDENITVKWFEFDAWKYPDRANLWESFTLELVSSVNEKVFDEALKVIEGKQNEDKKTLSKMICSLPLIRELGGKSLDTGFQYFLNKSPAKRTFEIQNILIDIINKLEEDSLYIVIEDIDRSGDSGIYFLETLNNFIKKADLHKKIKIIVPISDDSYIEKKASYHKCFDYINDYENPEYKLDNFCKAIFIDEITGKRVSVNQTNGEESISYTPTREYNLVLEFLEGLFMYYNNDFTLRELKLILRNANEKYKSILKSEGEGINYMICILLEASKLAVGNPEGDLLYNIWKKTNIISMGALFTSLLNQMNGGRRNSSIYEDHRKEKLDHSLPHQLKIIDFKLSTKVEKKDIYFHNPHNSHGNEPAHLYMGKFYFKD